MDRSRLSYAWKGFAAVGLLAVALAGCSGGGGGGGDTAAAPPAGGGAVTPPAGVPQDGTNATPATAASSAAWAALAPQATVTGVTINSAPVVKFTVKDAAGKPVVGLGNKSKSSSATVATLVNVGFTLAKLVPGTNGAPSKWVTYLVTRPPTVAEKTAVPATASCDATSNPTWCGTFPTFEREGTLVDLGDGSYQYTFYRDPKQAASIAASLIDSADGLSKKADMGDLSYDASLTHRLGIQIGGNAPGTGSNTPNGATVTPAVAMVNATNVVYDFRPDGGAVTSTRSVVTIDSCTECHAGKVLNHGSRTDPNYCATCHTDQIRYSFNKGEAVMLADGITFAVQTGSNAVVRPAQAILGGRAVGNLPNMIHKLHMGEFLIKQGYNFNNDELGLFNERRFPQDVRNCTKCHDGSSSAAHKTANGDNWKNVPSRLACGACHDGIDFSTGKGITLNGVYPGHIGGVQADDSKCALCHDPVSIDTVYHLPVTPPNTGSALHVTGGNANTNSGWIASNVNRLPAGAIKIAYDISSVSRNASKQPVMVFRMLQNGTAVPFNSPSSSTEMWSGFMGSPSAYFVFAVPQDGITAPADFNASASGYLRSVWNGTSSGTGKGTLTGPDASGYYTVTLTGMTVPDNAVMLTGGLGYSYNVTSTLPLTQTNLADYPVSAALATGQTNKIGGLIVIAQDVQKVATGYTGRRAIIEDARCNKCHQELGPFTKDAFHAGQRNDGSTCSWCHNPNRTSSGWSADSEYYIHAIHGGAKRTKQFTWHAGSAEDGFWGILFPGVLKKCETCHLPGTYDFSASASTSALPNRLYRTAATGTLASTSATAFTFSPYITKDFNYGSGFSFSSATGTSTEAAGTTLVNSPIAGACSACHDTDLALQHMKSNGGSFYDPRSTALAKAEQCTLCHTSGKVADIAVMHAK